MLRSTSPSSHDEGYLFNRWMDESPFDVDGNIFSDSDLMVSNVNINSNPNLTESRSSCYVYDDARSVISDIRDERCHFDQSHSPTTQSLPDIRDYALESDITLSDESISTEAASFSERDGLPYYNVPTLRDLPPFIKAFIGFHGYTTALYAERIVSDVKGGYFYGVVLGEEGGDDVMNLKLFFDDGAIDVIYNFTTCWVERSPRFLTMYELHGWILQNQNTLLGETCLLQLIPRPPSRLSFTRDLSVAIGFWGRMKFNNAIIFFKFSIPCRKKYAMLYNEAYVLSKLNHPHIVQYIGLTVDFACILLENAGHPIICFVEHFSQNITPVLRLGILRSLVEAMVYLKSKHVVHRNILPKNVFINANAVVKLGGFDTSAFQKPSVPHFVKHVPIALWWYHCNTVADPERYIDVHWQFKAPENLMSHEFSFQSDVYQFAMVAYYLYTVGKIPFHFCPEEVHPFTKVSLVSTAHTWIHFPSNVEQKLQKTLHNCIAYRPSSRPIIENVLTTFRNIKIN